jgi:acetoin utilization deacetylase AcuC-like enzyme
LPRGHDGEVNALPVFFHPALVGPVDALSPSASKPAAVVESWRRLGIPLEILAPVPVTPEQFELAHEARFVREVLACERENGFGNCLPGVARSLPWTTGAMLSAARRARERGGVAVAPCSGFHHARWDDCGGFCTFNGLMVTSAVLRAEGVRRIGILDLDNHYGNGTEAILDQLDARSWVRHFTAGAQYRRPSHASEFLTRLPSEVSRFADCDVVLYQAGADPHVNDPLGGWLTTEQLRERDGLVFSGLKALGIPVAWNLAGGYQLDAAGGISPSLEIHDNTLRECARVYLS